MCNPYLGYAFLMEDKNSSGKTRSIAIAVVILILALFAYKKHSDPNHESAQEEPQNQGLPTETSQTVSNDLLPTTTTMSQPTPPGEVVMNEDQKELQNEAKSGLSAAYTMMVAFYAEYDRYSSDLMTGFIPEGEILSMKLGFLSSYQPHDLVERENPDRKDTDYFVEASRTSDEPIMYSEEASRIDLQSLAKFCDKKCEASEREFELIVAVNLDDDPELDVWTVNEKKELVHRYDDMTNQALK